MSDIEVRIVDWQQDNADLRRIRETVFIAEQSVPPDYLMTDTLVAFRYCAIGEG